MGNCVATVKGNDKCNAETEPGWKYCDDHKNRPKAVEETQQKALATLSTGTLPEHLRPRNEMVRARSEGKDPTAFASTSPTNIVDQVNDMLRRTLEFESDAFTAYSQLEIDDWSFKDKAGTAQLRPEVAVYERALDRAGRVLPLIAKLGIEQQAAILEKAQYEGVKAAMVRALIRMGFDEQQIREANKIIAEEFRKMVGQSL